jgi:hypothetical protein
MTSRGPALLALACLAGCYVSYTDGYRIQYGDGKWAFASSTRLSRAFGEPENKNLEREGIFCYLVRVPAPMPRHGRETTASEHTHERLLVVCLRILETGKEQVDAWREAGRGEPLVLSTEEDDLSIAFLETKGRDGPGRAQSGESDVRAVLGGSLMNTIPEYVVAVCGNAQGTLKLCEDGQYADPKLWAQYLSLYGRGYEDRKSEPVYLSPRYPRRDILQPHEVPPEGFSRGYYRQLPIDLRATGQFKTHAGALEEKQVVVAYGRWDYRRHLRPPSE